MSYNAEQDLAYINKTLAYFLYLVGLDAEDIDSLTIDEIITKARLFSLITNEIAPHQINIKDDSDVEKISEQYRDQPAVAILRNQRISIVSNIRRFWYLRQLALGAM
jgi:hypothetical protein